MWATAIIVHFIVEQSYSWPRQSWSPPCNWKRRLSITRFIHSCLSLPSIYLWLPQTVLNFWPILAIIWHGSNLPHIICFSVEFIDDVRLPRVHDVWLPQRGPRAGLWDGLRHMLLVSESAYLLSRGCVIPAASSLWPPWLVHATFCYSG